MAAAAVPVIEFIGARLLMWLGLGAAGAGAAVVAKKKIDESTQARAAPIAHAQTDTKKKCDTCPPDKGAFFQRPTAGWSEDSIAYQARICGLPVGPGFITEWAFNGVTFDGFSPGECLLKEAKARYDQFFDEYGGTKSWWREGATTMVAEFMRQASAAQPRPPTRLRWHFMQPVSYGYFSTIFEAAHPDVEVVYIP